MQCINAIQNIHGIHKYNCYGWWFKHLSMRWKCLFFIKSISTTYKQLWCHPKWHCHRALNEMPDTAARDCYFTRLKTATQSFLNNIHPRKKKRCGRPRPKQSSRWGCLPHAVSNLLAATCEAAVDMSGVLQDQVQLPRGRPGHTDFTVNLNRTRPRYPLGEAAPGHYSFTELATQMLVLATCSQQSVRQQPTGVLCWKVHQTTLCSQKDSDLK